MAIRPWSILVLLPLSALAQTTAAEQAVILNEEMAFLMDSAPKARVYAAPDASANPDFRQRRNGPAPTQMPGVERAEDRYFSDEVTFQAAASDRITPEEDEANAYDEEAAEDGYRMDGTLPKPRP